MILDTNGSSCVKVNFGIGAASTTREWDIMVIFFFVKLVHWPFL